VSLLVSLFSFLVVLFVSTLVLCLMHRVHDWSSRRTLQFLVLWMPPVVVGFGLCSLRFSGNVLLIGMGGVALGALGLGILRLILITRFVTCRALFTHATVQTYADELARQLDENPVRVRLVVTDRPLALACGLRNPTILLSTWIVEHLDRRELEAVLAHELAHVARRDYLMGWLATMLRDAFFYLPTSWIAYRQLQQEKELACDDFTVCVTQRPLALASALAKVWLRTVDEPELVIPGGAQSLIRSDATIDGRIQRLLASPEPDKRRWRMHQTAFNINVSVFIPLGMMEVACLFFYLQPFIAAVGCHPLALCGR
jgi:Zn-dependent protease with chaperone function